MTEHVYDSLLVGSGAGVVLLAWVVSWWAERRSRPRPCVETNGRGLTIAPAQYTVKPSPLGTAWRLK